MSTKKTMKFSKWDAQNGSFYADFDAGRGIPIWQRVGKALRNAPIGR